MNICVCVLPGIKFGYLGVNTGSPSYWGRKKKEMKGGKEWKVRKEGRRKEISQSKGRKEGRQKDIQKKRKEIKMTGMKKEFKKDRKK